jgi:2',3'-cyclic-nucleotide 2'-phosphodiesterase / 3'-nucleotidase / 5'-nucleotidase
MYSKTMRALTLAVVLVLLFSQLSLKVTAAPTRLPANPVTFTILHTNDFHGQLEWKSGGSSSNPGMARLAALVKTVRTAVGSDKVLMLDVGDEMQGSLLSNIQKGKPTIAVYNAIGYAAATLGNHEFDWGKDVLQQRISEAAYPYVSANIVVNDTGSCSTAGWTPPSFLQPYVIKTVGTAPDTVNVAIIGVTTPETPIITIASATEGLCFKDPTASILNYYGAMKAQADVIVVLSHLGYSDGGYGYGIPIYGDQSLAKKLNEAGKPVNLILGGHSHTDLTAAIMVGNTTIAQAYYNGRRIGRADVTVNPNGTVGVTWTRLSVPTGAADPVEPVVDALIASYNSDPAYQALINQEIGWTNVPIARNYDGDSLMGYFVNDAIYKQVNSDAISQNDVDMVFNNAGGLRADISCPAYPCKLTYGMLFNVLPFGNATAIGTMTGAQILELLQQSASLTKGSIQPAGMRFSFYNYRVDLDPNPATVNWKAWSWGAFDACVINKTSGLCEPLELTKTYKVATNEFLAPAGQDNFYAFKYMQNVTYWGDMLNLVNGWVSATYTAANPYAGVLDGRITRLGNDAGGPIVPVTILHHNDSHGNLYKGSFVGYTQLATLIKQERAYNPNRTLLLSSGDNIQGDAMMYYFKSAPLGYAADGTPLAAPLTTHPMMAVMNAMGYDAWTLGNHEFNFGKDIFTAVIGQAGFPTLQANVQDDGQYGLGPLVDPYVEKTIGPENVKVAILGIGNHRVPNYELPSNIPGLTFSDPIAKTQELSAQLRPTNDVVIALTHIGFAENPASVEVDANVDTNLVAQTGGLDAVIGGHSHTNPVTGFGGYKYLPTYVVDANGVPVIINHAYRYNNTLGEIFLGLRAKAGGGYEVISRAGQYISVGTATVEDPAIKAIVDPYVAAFTTYNTQVIGQTTIPLDALQAFTQETNAANLQADASVYELETKNGIDVDFHLSGAMTNRAVATSGPYPVTLKVSDMFTLMPYENSLVVMEMNGPQLKAVLERAYRNYYYYKYVSGYGGYSYYTTCMLDINAGGKITYNDLYPAAYDPNQQYVVSLVVNGKEIDFNDASTYYRVSTVNYLAAGSCNFNNSGVSLWPLNQIVNDTQFYVRDAVIDYIKAMGTVSPIIERRLGFITDTTAPGITINVPAAKPYLHPELLPLDFFAIDAVSGVRAVWAELDGVTVTNGQVIDLHTLALGPHELTVYATDKAYNQSDLTVTFFVDATPESLVMSMQRFIAEGKLADNGVHKSLFQKLSGVQDALKKGQTTAALNKLEAFVNEVQALSGNKLTAEAANLLITDAQWVIAQLK